MDKKRLLIPVFIIISLLILISAGLFFWNVSRTRNNPEVIKPKLIREINPNTKSGIFYKYEKYEKN